ncbi:MAG: tetratricopeptide repeat protein, partial [Pseudomonadales bacterium]|nr:tetratricopeptide repeat protein [Pseudomonadales bacterium]
MSGSGKTVKAGKLSRRKQERQALNWTERGDVALNANDRAAAAHAYLQAYQLGSASSVVRLNLIVLGLELGWVAEASNALKNFMSPPFPASQAHNAMASYGLQQGNYEQAREMADRAVALDSGNAEAWNIRCNVLSAMQNRSEALMSVDRAIALAPQVSDFHYNRGLVLQSLERWDEALRAYEHSIDLNPHWPYAYLNSANIYVNRRDWPRAQVAMEAALALDRQTHYLLGSWLLTLMFQAKWEGLLEGMQEVLQGVEAGQRVTLLLPI